MRLQKPHLTKHRRARLIAWTLAMLAWLAWVFSADRAPTRRHVRQRYGFISLDALARRIALLIVLRAFELSGVRRYSANPFFNRVRGRKRWPRHAVRSLIGGRLHRALKHRDFAMRVAILTDAATHLDRWAAPYMNRLRRGMTRRWPIHAKRQAAAPLISIAAAQAPFANTS